MLGGWKLAAPGYAAAIVLGWLWLEAREDLASEIERCNADKLSAIVEAEAAARAAVERAFGERIAQLERNATLAEQAREVAEAARIEAENRPPEVREVIRRFIDTDACLTTSIPSDILDGLRN